MSCLIVQEDTCFQLNNFYLVVKTHLGKFADVDYYKVFIQKVGANTNPEVDNFGLLRIGDVNGGLSRELQLRHILEENSIIAKLLTFSIEEVELFLNIASEDYLKTSFNPPDIKSIEQTNFVVDDIPNPSNFAMVVEENQLFNNYNQLSTPDSYFDEEWESTENYDYLEDEVVENTHSLTKSKLLLLSYLPLEGQTLDIWLQQKHSCEVSIKIINQICQLFQQIYQQGWCCFQVISPFIQVDSTIKFFDLTNVHLLGEQVAFGKQTDYCAPEVGFNCPISEKTSAYIIGTLLYQSIYQQLPNSKLNFSSLDIPPIPGIYQIISLCLSVIVEDRIGLDQLTKTLSETHQTFSNRKVQWDVESYSTIGLSMQRLHNEDNYGVQQYSSSHEDTILAVLADGMGGLAQGEIASHLAVKTVIEAPIDCINESAERCNKWLVSVVEKANKCVYENVNNGGTTLSIVWANCRHLRIAHVGDSRIYLIRNNMICQLSEDHSLVAMLLAEGDITYEESYKHKQRNILTKCIGSKSNLSSNYVQTLENFGLELSIFLEQNDIIILCSDGVWDLVPQTELAKIFIEDQNLKVAVNNTIDLVLTRGARDNATIVAMKCNLSNQY
ncbi:protein phosphatase 2C domain-containing protein [Synechocystis sp. PCC 7509]|uniref:protein phosphatase 2C domain-containing protein n=1 Tax=Synechocystis sp. PCC 7509 TaxID=927677 RepID=UPI0002ACBAA0|nr:protein phosphatase 2C domain-containing protein [Synechocystis sp. PCC 7509]